MTSEAAETGYSERIRMNDYVGPPVFATLTWTRKCDGKDHMFGLMSHRCVRCGLEPNIRYDKERN